MVADVQSVGQSVLDLKKELSDEMEQHHQEVQSVGQTVASLKGDVTQSCRAIQKQDDKMHKLKRRMYEAEMKHDSLAQQVAFNSSAHFMGRDGPGARPALDRVEEKVESLESQVYRLNCESDRQEETNNHLDSYTRSIDQRYQSSLRTLQTRLDNKAQELQVELKEHDLAFLPVARGVS